MEKIILGTLNINQLGVQMGKTLSNPSKIIYEKLDRLIRFIRTFFSTNSNKKILLLNEMKYERNNQHELSEGYKKFKRIMEEEGYKIIKNNVIGSTNTVGFISLAITRNIEVQNITSPILSNYSKARYIELEYEGLVILGLHQDLKTNRFPLVDYVKQQDKRFIILGDLNVDKYDLKKNDYTEYESEYCQLLNEEVADVFGNSAVPTFNGRTRIDYVLVSSNLISNIINQHQDNSTRAGEESFTDHSFLQIELSINDNNRQ